MFRPCSLLFDASENLVHTYCSVIFLFSFEVIVAKQPPIAFLKKIPILLKTDLLTTVVHDSFLKFLFEA